MYNDSDHKIMEHEHLEKVGRKRGKNRTELKMVCRGALTEKPRSLIPTPVSFMSRNKDAQLGPPTPRFERNVYIQSRN